MLVAKSESELSCVEQWFQQQADEPIPLTSETKCKMWQGERKHQNTLSGVPVEQQATCISSLTS